MSEPTEPASARSPELTLTAAEEDALAQQSVVLRASGALLLVATAVLLVMNLVSGASGASAWVPLVVDVVVGAALLTGDDKAKSFAIFRAFVGLLFSAVLTFGAMKVGKSDAASLFVVQALISLSLLVLLWGTAGRARMRVGISLGVVAVIVSMALPVVLMS
jgi:hypothetical protein